MLKKARLGLLRPPGASVLLLQAHGAAAVVDYSSRVCTTSIPGPYIIYWELLATKGPPNGGGGDVLDRCCLEMEEALNSVYREGRVAVGSIGSLEIWVVRPGTFEELADFAVSSGASIVQYKVPRCVIAPPVIELLDARVVSSHFSPGLPHWAPDQRVAWIGQGETLRPGP